MPELDLISRVLRIIIFDLILSGDNAVVIGMAARRLPPRSRRRAVILGGTGAVGLRIIFTGIAALILDPGRGIPVIGLVGGTLLLWIAYKLIRPREHPAHVSEADSLMQAIRTIILADVVMSLDNILAVGAAAHGDLWLLLFGLALSIPLLLVGSNYIARLLGRVPILVYIGAVILVFTTIEMIARDRLIHDIRKMSLLEAGMIATVVSVVMILLARRAGRLEAEAALRAASGSADHESVESGRAERDQR